MGFAYPKSCPRNGDFILSYRAPNGDPVGVRWIPRQPLLARCRAFHPRRIIDRATYPAQGAPRADCRCGVYGAKRLDSLQSMCFWDSGDRPIFSASGLLVYQEGSPQGGWNLSWFTRDGKPAGTVGDLDSYFDPALSPDGKRLAVSLLSSQGTMDIWILDVLRKTKTRLTFGSSLQRHPVWSADGKTVSYSSNVKGQFYLYAKAADGSGAEQTVLESSDSSDYTDCASPDQRYLVYDRQANDSKTGLDIWALPFSVNANPFRWCRLSSTK